MTSEARTHKQCAWAACGVTAKILHEIMNGLDQYSLKDCLCLQTAILLICWS